jgi:hypothetical protein
VMLDDLISLNNGSTRYRIEGISGPINGRLELKLSRGAGIGPDNDNNFAFFPAVPGRKRTVKEEGSKFSYRIFRQPRIQESSRLELPEGYLIDLRYSGELIPNRQALPNSGNVPERSIFHEPTTQNPPIKDRSLRVFYKQDGSIDHYRHFATEGVTGQRLRIPSENLYFFLSRYESSPATENIFSNPSPLDRTGNLWLVINSNTGAVTISYNAPPPVSGDFAFRIKEARRIAQSGIAAAN